jgi:hypothetical protein
LRANVGTSLESFYSPAFVDSYLGSTLSVFKDLNTIEKCFLENFPGCQISDNTLGKNINVFVSPLLL